MELQCLLPAIVSEGWLLLTWRAPSTMRASDTTTGGTAGAIAAVRLLSRNVRYDLGTFGHVAALRARPRALECAPTVAQALLNTESGRP